MNQHIAENTVGAIQEYLNLRLQTKFNQRESSQLVKILFFDFIGYSSADLISRKHERLSESQLLQFHFAVKRLLSDEPVQYITGWSYFSGLKLAVNSSTLIPRPETEELVQLVVNDTSAKECSVLDIGTGSGCIALALKNLKPSWKVEACDVSKEALQVAQSNALRNKLDVRFLELDILLAEKLDTTYDVIVSNPPYIPMSEKSMLDKNVLDHEPHLALFVNDENPLLFYIQILRLAAKSLNPQGKIFFEIHESLSERFSALKDHFPIDQITIFHDMQDKPRMVKITLKQ